MFSFLLLYACSQSDASMDVTDPEKTLSFVVQIKKTEASVDQFISPRHQSRHSERERKTTLRGNEFPCLLFLEL